MNTARSVLLVAAFALLVGPAIAAKKKAAAPPCIKDKVLASFQTRMLQTELVVGALSCKLTPRYNEFVTAYRPDLMSAHKVLLRHFRRESQLEDYKSRTANEASQRSLANITEFCNYTSALYDKLLGPERVKLTEFVSLEPVASRHGQNACASPLVTASTTGKLVPIPRQKPEIADAAPAAATAPTAAVAEPKPEVAAETTAAPTAQQ